MCIYCRAVQVLTLVGRRVRAARPATVLAAAWLVLMLYAFPGQMTADTFQHIEEARSGLYTDAHPPAMNAVFWLAEQLASMPVAILVAQSLVFLVGVYALLRRTFAPARAAWITAALYVYPPIMTTMAVMWKDSIMVAMLVLGVVGLLDARRHVRLLALVALFVAGAVRYNAFAATFPLVFLLFEWRPGMHWVKRYAIALAAWLAITAAAFGLNAALTDTKMYYWHSSLAVHDIVGTLSHVDDTLPDAELARILDGTGLLVKSDLHAQIRKRYTPRNFFPAVGGPEPLWHLPFFGTTPAPEPQRDAIERAWKTIVTTYPVAYAKHRLAVTVEAIAFKRGRATWPVVKREFEYPQQVIDNGMSIRASAVQHEVTSWLVWLNKATPIYKPWLYLALAFILLVLTRRNRDVFALLTSGILLEASLAFLVHAPDYRYSHWMVTCTCIAVVLLVARRARGTVSSDKRRGA
jgi:hypothetical protein